MYLKEVNGEKKKRLLLENLSLLINNRISKASSLPGNGKSKRGFETWKNEITLNIKTSLLEGLHTSLPQLLEIRATMVFNILKTKQKTFQGQKKKYISS